MATKKPSKKAPAKPTPKAAGKGAPKVAARKVAVKKAAPKKAAPKKAPAKKAVPKKAVPKKAAAKKASTPAARVRAPRRGSPVRPPGGGLDPSGYFVARVLGEDAARQAPHPMTEGDEREGPMAMGALAEVPVPADDEGLGELPWSYGEDVFVGLPRDPRTLFFYWDHSEETRNLGFEWLDRPRAQLRVLALRDDGEWETVKVAEFALEARGFYVHELEPGRTYRGIIVAVSTDGRERIVGEPSNEVALPSSGPSQVVDDRFATIPWDLPLDGWLRDVRAGGAFPAEIRSMLARLSKGSKSPAPAWDVRSEPGRPSSPAGAWGGSGKRRGGKEGA